MAEKIEPKESEYEEITTIQQYFSQFKNPKEAFEKIHDIRKFEIELYWKRATYNWTFIGAVFAGYFTLASSIENSTQYLLIKIQFLLICLGIIFSTAWYFVNRGSKYWQNNWEKHLDVIEDEVVGPLYKTNAKKSTFRKNFWHLLSAYPFSPTKINHLLSLFVVFIWLILFVDFSLTYLLYYFEFKVFITINTDTIFYLLVSILTGFVLYFMFNYGRTGKPETKDNNTIVDFEKRGLKNKQTN